MRRVMLDLETMGTGTSAAIVAIGAVMFNVEAPESTDISFYSRVDLASSMSSGGTVDALTVQWWLQQSEDNRREVYAPGGQDLRGALVDFADFFKSAEEIWAGPAIFDVPILEHGFRICGFKTPWDFRQVRCWSTVRKLLRLPKEVNPAAHNALADARCAVGDFRKAWPRIKSLRADLIASTSRTTTRRRTSSPTRSSR